MGSLWRHCRRCVPPFPRFRVSLPAIPNTITSSTSNHLFLYSCLNARRRRSHGRRPYTGTGWMAPPPGPPPPNQPIYQQPYYGDPYYQPQPPPQYTANPQNYGYFGAQYGGPPPQQTGIELQQPPNVHTASGATEYAPPPGPPPAKT